MLWGINLLLYDKLIRVRFWLWYGKVVLDILSMCKWNTVEAMKKDIVCGKYLTAFILICDTVLSNVPIHTLSIKDKQHNTMQ